MAASPILVVGATGTVGSEVVRGLIEKGEAVRVFTRDRSRAAKFGDRVAVYEGDLELPETLAPAFAGVEKAFVVANGPGMMVEGAAFTAAKAAGVRYVVGVSAQQLDFPEVVPTPLGKALFEVERALKTSGLQWTILRPGAFASNLLLPFLFDAHEGAEFLPAGEGKEAPIDPRDIAAVAVEALSTPGHEGKTYVLTGPELLTHDEMMAIASRVLGRPIRFVDVSDAEARERFLGIGVPAPFVDSLMQNFAAIKAGRAYVTSTVAELTGRPARRFDDWVRDHAALLKA